MNARALGDFHRGFRDDFFEHLFRFGVLLLQEVARRDFEGFNRDGIAWVRPAFGGGDFSVS